MTRGRICHAILVLPEGIYQDGELRFSEGRIDDVLRSAPTDSSETLRRNDKIPLKKMR